MRPQWQDVGVLSPDSGVFSVRTRRRVIVDGARGLLALAALGAITTACGSPAPPAPDPLEAQLDAAHEDSELAAEAAKAAPPVIAPILNVIADERAQHATALIEEIARAAGKPIPTSTTSSMPSTTTSAAAAPPPTVNDVINALRTSADSAAKLVPTLSGYRAGLVGSIAAACTAAYSVALTPVGGQQ
jgi:hypothetical protein